MEKLWTIPEIAKASESEVATVRETVKRLDIQPTQIIGRTFVFSDEVAEQLINAFKMKAQATSNLNQLAQSSAK
tara:strand:- start:3561 stop:3782 length:222 start_codon:yes stop_codon:yes gene_type:complete